MKRLTSNSYWEDTYQHRHYKSASHFTGLINHCNRLILQKLLDIPMAGKRVLEIGAGDSYWLPYLAEKFPSSQFAGLDYSERGCELLSQRASTANVALEVIRADLFAAEPAMGKPFDVVVSFGVVEHFEDLAKALAAKRRYLDVDGTMFTLIPNMAGILGSLTKRMSPEVYAQHNPHNLVSFLDGHHRAGLTPVSWGYLGASNFGVLSSCIDKRNSLKHQLVRALTAASMANWWLEQHTRSLPVSSIFSPYMFAVSRAQG